MTSRSFFTVLFALIATISWLSPSVGTAQAKKMALFEVSIGQSSFTIALRDRRSIAQARRIVRKKSHGFVTGTVVPRRARYNEKWSFHLASKSIQFIQASIGT